MYLYLRGFFFSLKRIKFFFSPIRLHQRQTTTEALVYPNDGQKQITTERQFCGREAQAESGGVNQDSACLQKKWLDCVHFIYSFYLFIYLFIFAPWCSSALGL